MTSYTKPELNNVLPPREEWGPSQGHRQHA